MEGTSTLLPLPANTIRLIGSTQVITSVFSVIKELLENSFDAGSSIIDVKLENYGLDKIEIRDNGSGVKPEDVGHVGQRHYTSKITSHSDLESLTTYGFRGEAIASLCAVSEVTMTTKTATDDVGMTYTLTNKGEISSQKPSHLGQGTTITASHLFKNLPVRKQYHNTAKKKKEELKKIEDLLVSYGIVRPDVRLSLRHNKELLWQKNVLPDTKSVLLSVLGRNTFSNLEKKTCHLDDPVVDVEMFIPKPGSDVHLMSRTSTDRCFLSVNSRPVDIKELHKLLRQYYCTCHNIEGHRHPIYCLSVKLPPNEVDVNVDPNKTKVMLQHLDAVKNCIESELLYMYGPLENQPSWKYAEADSQKDAVEEVVDCEAKERVTKYLSNKKQKESVVDVSDIDESESKDNPEMNTRKPELLTVVSIVNGSGREKEADLDWETSADDSELLQMDVSTPNLTGRTTSFISSNEEQVSKPSNRQTDAEVNVKDHENQSASISNSEIFLEGDESKTVEDLACSQRSPKCNNVLTCRPPDILISEASQKPDDEADSSLKITCSQEMTDLGVGRFDISDDVLDDSFSSTQQQKNSNLDSPELNKSEGQNDASSRSSRGESWSKGISVTSSSGKTVQPVTLLAPSMNQISGKRPSSPSQNTSMRGLAPPEKKRAVGEKPLLQGQTTLYKVENQAVRQESAFDIFIREKTPEVAEDHPDADDEEVTAILEDMWSNMSEKERQTYRAARMNLYKKDLKQKELSLKVKKKIDKGRSSVRDHLVSSSKKSSSAHSDLSSNKINFSLAELKRKYSKEFRDSQSQQSQPDSLRLIGQLKTCGSWVCCRGNRILLTNPHRLAETVLYHKLLSQHKVTSKPLQRPVTLTVSNIGDAGLMKTLENLVQWKSDPYVYVTDPRILANGFNVRCHMDNDGEFCAELMGVAAEIAMFGVADLSETLDLIAHTAADTLKKSRPLKVINYLKSEAVRMMRQSSAERCHDDVQELLDDLESVLPDGCRTCLHNKPFFHQVFDMKNAPASCNDTVMESQQSQN